MPGRREAVQSRDRSGVDCTTCKRILRAFRPVVFSSVVRSTQQSESHGGVYLLDLETEQLTQMIDWDDQTIDLSQRGGDRGLRGIAFWEDRMYLAAADEIFVYDPGFSLVGSIKNPYLRHCHEINTGGGKLFLGSVGYDTILEYDIAEERFSAGYCIRYSPLRRKLRRKNREGFQFRPRPHADRVRPQRRRRPPEGRHRASQLPVVGGRQPVRRRRRPGAHLRDPRPADAPLRPDPVRVAQRPPVPRRPPDEPLPDAPHDVHRHARPDPEDLVRAALRQRQARVRERAPRPRLPGVLPRHRGGRREPDHPGLVACDDQPLPLGSARS